jgi:hypothetical protein
MVAMLCIWRSGIGVSVSGCMFGGIGIYIYSSGSSVQKRNAYTKQKFPFSRSGGVIADCNSHFEHPPPLQVKPMGGD